MGIRIATEDDAQAISDLIVPLADKFIAYEFSTMGRRNLLESLSVESVRRYFRDGLRFHVYEESDEVIAVVATRGNSHLFNLFVAESAQGRGIARLLWDTARSVCLAAGGSGEFTVNSSRYAAAMYQKFGFQRVGPESTKDDVVCVPMRIASTNEERRATSTQSSAGFSRFPAGASTGRGEPCCRAGIQRKS
jgi:GNAT superfamily N-acetyltransferase